MSIGYVYFFYARQMRRFKIGTTVKPLDRFKAAQSLSPEKLTPVLIFETDDSYPHEKKLHNAFKKWRCHGEWFDAAPPLIKYLKWKGVELDLDNPLAVDFPPNIPGTVNGREVYVLPEPVRPRVTPYTFDDVLRAWNHRIDRISSSPLQKLEMYESEARRGQFSGVYYDNAVYRLVLKEDFQHFLKGDNDFDPYYERKGPSHTAWLLYETRNNPDHQIAVLFRALDHDVTSDRGRYDHLEWWKLDGMRDLFSQLVMGTVPVFQEYELWHHRMIEVLGRFDYRNYAAPDDCYKMAKLLEQVATHLAFNYVIHRIVVPPLTEDKDMIKHMMNMAGLLKLNKND